MYVYIKLPYLLLFYETEDVRNFSSENIFDSNAAEIVDCYRKFHSDKTIMWSLQIFEWYV